MSIIKVLPNIIEESKEVYESICKKDALYPFEVAEKTGQDSTGKSGLAGGENMLFYGDNMDVMMFLNKHRGMQGKIRLIYIDPPFLTGSNYGTSIKLNTGVSELVPTVKQRAYSDIFEKGLEGYLRMLTVRLFAMKDLLAEEGSIFVHLDWHAVHYVKVIMDEIFGEKNFVNEIIWQYKSGGASSRRFARKHDNILFYSKSSEYYFKPEKEKSYNRDFKPYRFKGVKEYKDQDGWYTMVNRKDVWELDMVGRTSAERTGYVTQKPESLIERMILSCTREGDLCADFFGGSGTMAGAAEKMGRSWISCDIGKPAIISTVKRMVKAGASFNYYEQMRKGINFEGAKPEGKAEFEVSTGKDALTDKIHLKIKLQSYQVPSLKNIPVEKKHMPYVEKAIKADSLQFVAYWAVDIDYDGAVPRPDKYMIRTDGGLDDFYENMISQVKAICISGMDIFGNRFLHEWKEDSADGE